MNGSRKMYRYWHYVLDATPEHPNWKTYYRHLIASPCYIYNYYPEGAHLLLDHPVCIHGDYMEQLASRQEIIATENIIKVADILYYDLQEGNPRKGATSRNKPGNIRRFAQDIFLQLDTTYDLHSMNENAIISLLPNPEFKHWLKTHRKEQI